MKIALVHDWLVTLGGAERVLIELHKILPDAPIYTLFYNDKFKAKYLPDAKIRPSYLQKFPLINKHYKYAALLMPSAIESFDLSDFDVVISSSVFFSKGLVLRPKTRHICYCYSPTRQLWDLHAANGLWTMDYGNNKINHKPSAISYKLAQHLLRLWDRQAADRVDEFIAISGCVKDRIKKYYKRDSKVVYPPLSLESGIWNPAEETRGPPRDFLGLESGNQAKINLDSRFKTRDSKFYLIVSRLYRHKNIDIAVEAFSKLNLPLLIIGDGPEKKSLESTVRHLQSKNIKFLGFVSDEELLYYYQNCRALIMPQEEDFGLTPLEAMSFGKPVLALRRGGALETLREGITGEFFDDPIPEGLADGVRRLNKNFHNYRPELIQSHAKQFSPERFKNEILEKIRNT